MRKFPGSNTAIYARSYFVNALNSPGNKRTHNLAALILMQKQGKTFRKPQYQAFHMGDKRWAQPV